MKNPRHTERSPDDVNRDEVEVYPEPGWLRIVFVCVPTVGVGTALRLTRWVSP